MADIDNLKMVEPPVIDGLSDAQEKAVSSAYRALEVECDAIDDMLTEAGLGSVHAVSATSHALMNSLVRHCFITAILDGRQPNREWFLHNCATHFDKWANAQSVGDEKERDQ